MMFLLIVHKYLIITTHDSYFDSTIATTNDSCTLIGLTSIKMVYACTPVGLASIKMVYDGLASIKMVYDVFVDCT